MNNTTLGRSELGQRTVQPTKAHGISRRTVAKGMAWTTPVVLSTVTAPVFAASAAPCASPATLTGQFLTTYNSTLDRNEVNAIRFGTGTTEILADVTYETIGWGANNTKPGDTSVIGTTEFSSTDQLSNYNYITLQHPDQPLYSKGDTIIATIKFRSQLTVRNLTFSITDIDRIDGAWIDHVVLTSGFTKLASPDTGANVIGSGTAATPYTSSVQDDISSSRGDLRVRWAAYMSEIKVTYVAADDDNTSGEGQHIGLGRFTISSC